VSGYADVWWNTCVADATGAKPSLGSSSLPVGSGSVLMRPTRSPRRGRAGHGPAHTSLLDAEAGEISGLSRPRLP